MTEDVSAYARLSVTLVLLALLISTALNMYIYGDIILMAYTDKFIGASTTRQVSELMGLNTASIMSAPSIYKTLELYSDVISDFDITYKDGTTSTDIDKLLDKSELEFEVTVVETGQSYKVAIKEV